MKLMAVRLPDEVAAAVEREAVKQERSKSAVVVRALREALGVARAEDAEKISGEPVRKRKPCQHGNDAMICKMPACRQARG